MGILLLVWFKGVGLLLVLGNRHLAGLAVAVDLEEGGARLEVEVVGEGCGVFAF